MRIERRDRISCTISQKACERHACISYPRRRLWSLAAPVYVKRLVDMCRKNERRLRNDDDEEESCSSSSDDDSKGEEAGDGAEDEQRSVKIYHYIKMIHFLVLDAPKFRETILDACEEELMFYYSKKILKP